jgi:hypothetical protein
MAKVAFVRRVVTSRSAAPPGIYIAVASRLSFATSAQNQTKEDSVRTFASHSALTAMALLASAAFLMPTAMPAPAFAQGHPVMSNVIPDGAPARLKARSCRSILTHES